jgi:hypothetical protein
MTPDQFEVLIELLGAIKTALITIFFALSVIAGALMAGARNK